MRHLTTSLLVAVALVACSPTAAQFGLERLSESMPRLRGEILQGGFFDSNVDARGRALVLNFWASWCGPCRREQPMLQALWTQYRSRGVLFVGVNSRDQEAAAKAHLDEFGVTYPSIRDPDGKIAFDWGINAGLPGTVVVDVGGVIRYRKQGEITREELLEMLDDVLTASPAWGSPNSSS